MTEEELEGTVRDINEEIRRLIYHQQVLADVHDRLERRNRRPLEEDYIDADLRDEPIGQPVIRRIDGVEIMVWKLHRRGTSAADIRGADLMYEIAGEKFVLIQYKTPTTRGAVGRDADQLGVLMESCAVRCPPAPKASVGCGAWHAVRNVDGFYHPACMAAEIFDHFASRHEGAFVSGFSKREFDEQFAACSVGSLVRIADPQPAIRRSVENGHLVVVAQQRGRF
jgi:hypothetical protein